MNLAKEIEKLSESIKHLETIVEDQEFKIESLETKIDLKTSSESNVRRWNFSKVRRRLTIPTPWKTKK